MRAAQARARAAQAIAPHASSSGYGIARAAQAYAIARAALSGYSSMRAAHSSCSSGYAIARAAQAIAPMRADQAVARTAQAIELVQLKRERERQHDYMSDTTRGGEREATKSKEVLEREKQRGNKTIRERGGGTVSETHHKRKRDIKRERERGATRERGTTRERGNEKERETQRVTKIVSSDCEKRERGNE